MESQGDMDIGNQKTIGRLGMVWGTLKDQVNTEKQWPNVWRGYDMRLATAF